MGVQRIDDRAVTVAGRVEVVDKTPAAGDEALIFDAPNRLPDTELVHVSSLMWFLACRQTLVVPA
jgi:hypothetical protein